MAFVSPVSRVLLLTACILSCVTTTAALAGADQIPVEQLQFFEAKIRPVLVKHCYECHSGKSKSVKGGLLLDTRERIRKGGDSGAVIVAGKPQQSLLIQALKHDGLEMPPEQKLPEHVIADFVKWIETGAPDPRETAAGNLSPEEAARQHWAFQPVRKVTPPDVKHSEWIKTPVDRFVLSELEGAGITPAPKADSRTLIRRMTYDLIGLPPTPAEVEEFVAAAQVPGQRDVAIERLIERLLASPHYGERWGRHWLDVVRYADSAGETADFPAPHAWRYRNYVIDAFNADKPYDQFLREQLAGDLLATKAPPEQYSELVTATGYLAISRRFGFDVSADHYLTIEDTIDTLGKSVLGLTIACARCHNHKYDPISAVDYYGLYGIFDSTKFAFPGCEKEKRPRDMVPLQYSSEVAQKVSSMQAQMQQLDAASKQATEALAPLQKKLRETSASATRLLGKGEFPEGGGQSFELATSELQIQPGEVIQLTIDRKAHHGGDSTLIEFEIAELAGDKRLWNVTQDVLDNFLADNPHADRFGNAATWCLFDGRNGPHYLAEPVKDFQGKAGLNLWKRGDTPSAWVNASQQPIDVWTKLPPRSFFVHPAADGPVLVAWVSPIAGTIRVSGRAVDAHPNNGDGVSWQLDHVAAALGADLKLLGVMTKKPQQLADQRRTLAAQVPVVPVAYAVSEGTPHNARLHKRGEPADLGPEVPRKFLDLFGGQRLPEGDKSSGRVHLADWLTDPQNPLTARVFVNRIWQHHFGRGLVETPNDFGTRGAAPSNQQLLDWLAAEFIHSGWSVKSMHRLIMQSSVYQVQASADPAASASKRAFTRRRLDAEQIRDSILAVSGDLDNSPGGSHPFPAEETWGFTQHGPFNAVYDTKRRAVYLMVQRIKRHPFLGLFDGADPSTSTPVRSISTVPTQALFFLNDPFVHDQANKFAARLLAGASNDCDRVELACRLLYGRPAGGDDCSAAAEFFAVYTKSLPGNDADQARWVAYCRVLLSSNEFLHVE